MNYPAPQGADTWHLDKKVPISLIAFMILQTISFVWFSAKLYVTVQETAQKQVSFELWRETQNGTEAKTESRLAVIEERSKDQSETLHRIDDRFEKMMTFAPHDTRH